MYDNRNIHFKFEKSLTLVKVLPNLIGLWLQLSIFRFLTYSYIARLQIVLDNPVDWSHKIRCKSHFGAVSLWLSFLAKCKTFNCLYVGRSKYLISVVNPTVIKRMYMTSELCHRYQRILIPQFNNFYAAKIRIYSAAFSEMFVQIW